MKYPKYQDYVIKNGKFIGEFEKMYQDHKDPWRQSVSEKDATDKKIVLSKIQEIDPKRVIEIGCGLGHFTNDIRNSFSGELLGIDISKTAIKKAQKNYPNIRFETGDLLSFNLFDNFLPDMIIMAEVTWYVLDRLEAFKKYLKEQQNQIILVHLLTFYESNKQTYGKEFFTNMDELLHFFDLNYIEYGIITKLKPQKSIRSYFLGHAI